VDRDPIGHNYTGVVHIVSWDESFRGETLLLQRRFNGMGYHTNLYV